MSETFTKTGSAPHAAAAEAAYLRWLREGSEAVVEVISLDDASNTLTIERVSTTRPTREAARRGEPARAGKFQPGVAQAVLDPGQETFGQGFQGFGGQLFAAEFHQKGVSAHCAASAASLASTSSRRSAGAIGKPRRARACT